MTRSFGPNGDSDPRQVIDLTGEVGKAAAASASAAANAAPKPGAPPAAAFGLRREGGGYGAGLSGSGVKGGGCESLAVWGRGQAGGQAGGAMERETVN